MAIDFLDIKLFSWNFCYALRNYVCMCGTFLWFCWKKAYYNISLRCEKENVTYYLFQMSQCILDFCIVCLWPVHFIYVEFHESTHSLYMSISLRTCMSIWRFCYVECHLYNFFVHHSWYLICLTQGLCLSKIYIIVSLWSNTWATFLRLFVIDDLDNIFL